MRLELTHRGSYAIRAAIALARAGEGTLVSASRIADTMAIPRRFLPQVMADLARAGLVDSAVGRAGGYRLARRPDAISLLEVIEAAEGDTRRRTCVLRGVACGTAVGPCDVHEVFAAAQAALIDRLGGATLAAVLERDVGGPPGAIREAAP